MCGIEPSAVLVLEAPVTHDDIPVLCARMHRLIADSEPCLVICDVSAVTRPDAATVNALARLQLTARRLGHRMVLSRASPELVRLLRLVGLQEVLPEL